MDGVSDSEVWGKFTDWISSVWPQSICKSISGLISLDESWRSLVQQCTSSAALTFELISNSDWKTGKLKSCVHLSELNIFLGLYSKGKTSGNWEVDIFLSRTIFLLGSETLWEGINVFSEERIVQRAVSWREGITNPSFSCLSSLTVQINIPFPLPCPKLLGLEKVCQKCVNLPQKMSPNKKNVWEIQFHKNWQIFPLNFLAIYWYMGGKAFDAASPQIHWVQRIYTKCAEA